MLAVRAPRSQRRGDFASERAKIKKAFGLVKKRGSKAKKVRATRKPAKKKPARAAAAKHPPPHFFASACAGSSYWKLGGSGGASLLRYKHEIPPYTPPSDCKPVYSLAPAASHALAADAAALETRAE